MRSRQRNTIIIPLRSRPGDYVPGSGPALRGLTLQPTRRADSTGYIEDRILLSPTGVAAGDGQPLSKRLGYIVGWRDLPAVRLFVPAMDILDYVAPYALEEFEFNRELEMDATRARLEEERQALRLFRKLDEQEAKRFGVLRSDGGGGGGGGGGGEAAAAVVVVGRKRKRGGPPSGQQTGMVAVVADSADEEEDELGHQQRLRGGTLGLCTPKKKRMLAGFADGYSTDESPSEQLLFDMERSTASDRGSSAAAAAVTVNIRSSDAGGSARPISVMVRGGGVAEYDEEEEEEQGEIDDDDNGVGRNGQHRQDIKAQCGIEQLQPVMDKGPPRSSMKPMVATRPKQRAVGAVAAAAAAKAGQQVPRLSATLKPSPARPRTGLPAWVTSSRSITEYLVPMQRGSSSSSGGTFTVPLAQRPRPAASRPKPQLKSKPASKLSAPAPAAATAAAATTKTILPPLRPTHVSEQSWSKPNATPLPSHSQNTWTWTNSTAKMLPTTTKTINGAPANNTNKSSPLPFSVPNSLPAAAADDDDDDDDDDEDDDEDAWAIDCLEDMELYEVEGRGLVRYFKVRWAGDWPPDQKTTWEPEEHIPDAVVGDFCRTFRRKGGKKGRRRRTRRTKTPPPLSRQTTTTAAAATVEEMEVEDWREKEMENDQVENTFSPESGLFVNNNDDDDNDSNRDINGDSNGLDKARSWDKTVDYRSLTKA